MADNTIPVGSPIFSSVQLILDDLAAKQAALKSNAPGANAPTAQDNAAPPRNIQAFSQTITRPTNDTLQTAPNVGNLIRDQTQLSVAAALTKGDPADFYQFNVKTAGNLGIAVASDKGVRLQLLKPDGTIVADSEATFGDKATNYQELAKTALAVTPGTYVLKVTRQTGALNTDKPNYVIKIEQSNYYTKDYTTTQTPAAPANPYGGALAAANSANNLNTVLNEANSSNGSTLFQGGTLWASNTGSISIFA